MENLNHLLFLFLNSGTGYSGSALDRLAVFTAEWLVWALPLLLAGIWFAGNFNNKKAAVNAGLAAVVALGIGGLIGWLWPHPRPFMLGLGHLLIAHAPDASLPSDHLTLWWGISLGLAYCSQWKRIGLLLTLAGLAPAWARIYVGVHFPADMLSAFFVSFGAAHIVSTWGRYLVNRMTLVGIQLQCRLFKRRVPN